jgi:hypothetical protein
MCIVCCRGISLITLFLASHCYYVIKLSSTFSRPTGCNSECCKRKGLKLSMRCTINTTICPQTYQQRINLYNYIIIAIYTTHKAIYDIKILPSGMWCVNWLQHCNVSVKLHGTYLRKLNQSYRLRHPKSHNTANVNIYYTFLKRCGNMYLHPIHTGTYMHCAQQSTLTLQKGYERTGQTTFPFTLFFLLNKHVTNAYCTLVHSRTDNCSSDFRYQSSES